MNPTDHHAAQREEAERLRAEILSFESHLARIDGEDDCAYDKARIRAFETMLQERRTRLHALLASA